MKDSAVIDDHTWLEGFMGSKPTHPSYSGPGGIVALVAGEMPVFGERTVLVGAGLALSWGLVQDPGNRSHNEHLLTSPAHERGPVGPWMTYRTKGGPSLHVGILPWILQTPGDHPMFAGLREISHIPGSRTPHVFSAWDRTDGHLATRTLARMTEWERMVGLPWRGIPGVMGTALLRQIHNSHKRQPLWHHSTPIGAYELELSGWTAPNISPGWGGTVRHPIMVDSVRAYLAAAGTVEVADSKLEHSRAIKFDPDRPGWWRIDPAPWSHPHLLPDPLMRPDGHTDQDGIWVSTSTLKLWDRLSDDGEAGGYVILDSYTAEKGIRIFRTWAERLNLSIRERAAVLERHDRSPGADPLTGTLKATYRQAIGLMNHEGAAIYRPDWHYAIIAGHRNTMWHKLWRSGICTGLWPVKIATDAAVYNGQAPTSDNPADSATRLILGPRLGQFKIKALRARTVANPERTHH